MRLLIVNDEELTANAMKMDICWQNYGINETFLAFNARKAKEILNERKIDIVLLDIEMPDENGISLLRWIREHNIKVECIFLTCHASFEYAKEAVKLGCQDYILMPVRYEEIGEAVNKVVTRIRQNIDALKLQEYGKQWVKTQKDEAQEMEEDKKSPAKSVEEAVKYIMENLCSVELSVNEVASHCYLTPIYMSRIFKKDKGISMSQFIIQEKMVLAKRLLKETDLTANTIAIQVGYPSYPHFSSTFKKYYGYSPSQIDRMERS